MKLEVRELFATADRDGNYLDVSQEKRDCEGWLEEGKDKQAVKVINGFGLFFANSNEMPDNVVDFHYTSEDAVDELDFLQKEGKDGRIKGV